MGLEQLGNQIVNKPDYINDLENTIRECLFIMKDGFWESKRFELYQKKRERELLDFFYSYYKDTSCENLPESIQELPLYLIEKEYEFILRIKELEERTFRSIKKEGYCLLFYYTFSRYFLAASSEEKTSPFCTTRIPLLPMRCTTYCPGVVRTTLILVGRKLLSTI